MALKVSNKKKPAGDEDEQPDGEAEEDAVVDAPAGYAPRVVKVPMHDGADVNHDIAQKQERAMSKQQKPDVKLAKGAGWNAKDERQYKHIKESGASESIAAATVNKQRKKEGRLLHKPNVKHIVKGTAPEYAMSGASTIAAMAPVAAAPAAKPAAPAAPAAPPSTVQPRPVPPFDNSAAQAEVNERNARTQAGYAKFREQDAARAQAHPQQQAPQPSTPKAPMIATKSIPNVKLLKAMPSMPQPTTVKPPSVYLPGVHSPTSPMRKKKAKPDAKLVMKGGGAGSRGGKIAYYTKSGAPVYQSKVKKMAPQFSQMAHNWSANADKAGGLSHADAHATAAKQHLAAAFYNHHAGNDTDARNHLDHAKYHEGKAKHFLPQADESHARSAKRTLKWVEKNHEATRALVKHGAPYNQPHSETHDASGAERPHTTNMLTGKRTYHETTAEVLHGVDKKLKKALDELTDATQHFEAHDNDVVVKSHHGDIRDPGSRGGNIVGYTKSGKPVYGAKRVHGHLDKKASELVHKHGLFSEQAHPAISHSQRALDQHFSESTPGYEMHWTPQDHKEAADILQEHKRTLKDPHMQYSNQGLANRHHDAAEKKEEAARYAAIDRHEGHPHGTTAARAASMKKAITPSNSIGGNMKNEVEDLFKSELGEANADKPITKCVHCSHDLSKSDLRKGLGTHFVADDNDQPHDGKEGGQVDPSRPGSGVSENDVIAPLLKGLKGADAGDNEEFVISKSEMDEMDLNTEGMQDGWYTITKGEMKKLGAEQHIAFLADRKQRVAKSSNPAVIAKSAAARPGYTPRAGGVHGASGEPLVQWAEGSDKEVAKYIEQNGGYGPGTDELVRTGQRH